LTGAKVREEIYQAFEMIYPVLQGLSLFTVSLVTSILTTIIRFPQSLRCHLTLCHLTSDTTMSPYRRV
jgi:hypothetical protein